MSDTVNALQTLALVLTCLVMLAILLWIVYFFPRMVRVFNAMLENLENPKVNVQTSTISTPMQITKDATVPVPEPQPTQTVQEDAAPEIKRYPCHRCSAKLPETPTHSIVKDGITLLVFKCRRCSKETEVDPEKTAPIACK